MVSCVCLLLVCRVRLRHAVVEVEGHDGAGRVGEVLEAIRVVRPDEVIGRRKEGRGQAGFSTVRT